MISGKDQHILWIIALHILQVLIDRIRSTGIPFTVGTLLIGRQHGHSSDITIQIPRNTDSDMGIQSEGLVATLDVKTPRRLPCPPANSMAIISFLIISSPLSSLPPVVINSRLRLLSDVSICLEKVPALSFGCDNLIITHCQRKVNIYY